MKKLFYASLAALAGYEILKIYFIMPMPGSQRIDSLDAAYFLHRWRWIFRTGLLLLLILSAPAAFRSRRKWIPALALVLAAGVAFMANFRMKADRMFLQPRVLRLVPAAESRVPPTRLVLGVTAGDDARAYPIQYLAYHHQVRDTLAGRPVMVTYCNVCRTGRVFEPLVDARPETFRLVGMDHFNAMFEDATTGSWWRQATGEAVAGPLKGKTLPELPVAQMTLAQWLGLYPKSRVMQADEFALEQYDSLARFERGKSESDLTRTDSLSWQDKSWVVGIEAGGAAKAYDWNELKTAGMIRDRVGNQAVILVLAGDGNSYAAFKDPMPEKPAAWQNDTLRIGSDRWDMRGRPAGSAGAPLQHLNAHQEFWHSWQTFHPATARY